MNVDTLRADLADLLGEEPADDADLFDLGLDSVRLMMLVEKLRDTGHDVEVLDLAEQPTIAAWAKLLTKEKT
jgi:aryl carrier-like protein